MSDGNGSNGRRPKAPWNKGLRAKPGETPVTGQNGGRRPGDRNRETVERGATLREIRDRLAAREVEQGVGLDQIFDRLRVEAVTGNVKSAALYLAYRLGRPQESVELTSPLFGNVGPAGFRCFLSDGRPVPSGPVSLPGRSPTRS